MQNNATILTSLVWVGWLAASDLKIKKTKKITTKIDADFQRLVGIGRVVVDAEGESFL